MFQMQRILKCNNIICKICPGWERPDIEPQLQLSVGILIWIFIRLHKYHVSRQGTSTVSFGCVPTGFLLLGREGCGVFFWIFYQKCKISIPNYFSRSCLVKSKFSQKNCTLKFFHLNWLWYMWSDTKSEPQSKIMLVKPLTLNVESP